MLSSQSSSDLATLLQAPPDGVAYYRDLEKAKALIDAQKWAEAEPILTELSSAYPLNGTIWGQLAQSLRKQGKYEKAIAAYERVLSIQGPGLPYSARYWTAASHAALGHTDQALEALQQMVFREAYLQQTELLEDENFAVLKNDARFQKLAGKEDVSKLSRDEGWIRDIDVLAEQVKRNNPAGTEIPAEFFARQQNLKKSISKLTDLQMVAGMGHMLEALGRGHTGLWLGAPGSRMEFKPMPIHLYAFPEGIYITEAGKGFEFLAGAQVLEFGTTPALEALQRVSESRSVQSPMEHLWIDPEMLAVPAILQGLDIVPKADSAELKLKMPDGSVVTKTFPTVPATQPTHKLNPPPGVPAPLFLKNLKEMHWFEPLPEQRAIYVQVNNIMNDPDETLAQFGLRLRKSIAELKPDNIILDLRHNNGGNTFTYVELLRTLIAFSSVEGHTVYALIARNVYSAAANFSTDLERLVRPVFVGEPTSQMGNQWGDESSFILPYSGIMGAVSGLRWQLSHPWDKRLSIVPQMPVQLTAKDYFEGKDPVLDAVFLLIEQH